MSRKRGIDLREYRILGMPLLLMLGSVAAIGIVLTLVLYFFF
ncbi:MAG: hypothetical protein ABI597_11895 [Gammaproteobacteria bacterium]